MLVQDDRNNIAIFDADITQSGMNVIAPPIYAKAVTDT
jgi:hypothetical protein